MIRFIKVEDLLPIRSHVLREGRLSPEESRFETDTLPGAFHLGFYEHNELACIASFHPQSFGSYPGTGYQLRGMATIEKYRGRGFGNRLLTFSIVYLKGQNVNYLWCNARKKALPFYLSIGFENVSAEFELPFIGPHYTLYLKIS